MALETRAACPYAGGDITLADDPPLTERFFALLRLYGQLTGGGWLSDGDFQADSGILLQRVEERQWR